MVTPMTLAQNWIAENDEQFRPESCGFTVSETKHVDEAYEFVFTNLAMMVERARQEQDGNEEQSQFVVLPHVLCGNQAARGPCRSIGDLIPTAWPSLRRSAV